MVPISVIIVILVLPAKQGGRFTRSTKITGGNGGVTRKEGGCGVYIPRQHLREHAKTSTFTQVRHHLLARRAAEVEINLVSSRARSRPFHGVGAATDARTPKINKKARI